MLHCVQKSILVWAHSLHKRYFTSLWPSTPKMVEPQNLRMCTNHGWVILTLWSLNDNVYHIHASISCAIIWLHEATVSRGLLSRHSLVSTPGPCFSVCVLWPCQNYKSEKTCILMLFLSNSYITPTRNVSGLNCDAWGRSGFNWIQAAYKCFVAPVAKQMMSCLCVSLASQFKLSLAAVAGSVAYIFAGLRTFVTVVQNNLLRRPGPFYHVMRAADVILCHTRYSSI